MPNEKSPDSISFEGDSWFEHFIHDLELEHNEIAKSLAFSPLKKSENRRNVLYAVRRLLSNAGMKTKEMLSVIGDDRYGWTDEKNARRFELIEKQLDDALAYQEALELESLTEQMRYAMKEIEQSRVDGAKKLLDEISESMDQTGEATS